LHCQSKIDATGTIYHFDYQETGYLYIIKPDGTQAQIVDLSKLVPNFHPAINVSVEPLNDNKIAFYYGLDLETIVYDLDTQEAVTIKSSSCDP